MQKIDGGLTTACQFSIWSLIGMCDGYKNTIFTVFSPNYMLGGQVEVWLENCPIGRIFLARYIAIFSKFLNGG